MSLDILQAFQEGQILLTSVIFSTVFKKMVGVTPGEYNIS